MPDLHVCSGKTVHTDTGHILCVVSDIRWGCCDASPTDKGDYCPGQGLHPEQEHNCSKGPAAVAAEGEWASAARP